MQVSDKANKRGDPQKDRKLEWVVDAVSPMARSDYPFGPRFTLKSKLLVLPYVFMPLFPAQAYLSSLLVHRLSYEGRVLICEAVCRRRFGRTPSV